MHKILNIVQENRIGTYYRTNQLSIKELAEAFGVSTRTIGRTLQKQGIPLPGQIKNGNGQHVLNLLKEYGVSVSRLRLLLEQDKKTRKTLPILTTAQMLLPLDTGEKQE